MLRLNQINKSFGNQQVLEQLSVDFSSKEVSIIVGTNGSGKTTLLNIIAGLLSADSGDVTIDGISLGSLAYKQQLFYVPSDFYLPDYMTGKEYAAFILSRYTTADKDYFNLIVSSLDLESALNKMIETYSFGMKKKLQIAIAASLNTSILLADELFSGLDFETTIIAQEILKKLSQQTKIIMVSHDLNTLLKFDKDIWIMRQGHLTRYQGNPISLTSVIKEEGEVNEKIQRITGY